MRQHGRRNEAYTTTKRTVEPMSANWTTRVYNETMIREKQWSRAHRNREMSAVQWNSLWERVRNELYGERWACDQARSCAKEMVRG